jgi:5'-3' exonuclease
MLALIDGDVLAHLACPTRNEINGDCILHRYNEQGQRIAPVFSKKEDAKHMEDCWDNFQYRLEELLNSLFTNNYLMAVKSDENFRDFLYPDYKLQRKNKPNQNVFVPAVRTMAIMSDLAVEAVGREADDLVRIWSVQARNVNEETVVCTIDKDLKCLPGRYYDIKNRVLTLITDEFATRFFYEQLLKGDPTDNIPGVPGIGPVKAQKLLEKFSSEEEYQEVIVDTYIKAFGDAWLEYLLSNGKLLYLQKHEHDFFRCRSWPIVQELLG